MSFEVGDRVRIKRYPGGVIDSRGRDMAAGVVTVVRPESLASGRIRVKWDTGEECWILSEMIEHEPIVDGIAGIEP